MLPEVDITDVGFILKQDDDAIFIPNTLVDKVVATLVLAKDGIEYSSNIEYLKILMNEEGILIDDGCEYVFINNQDIDSIITILDV